MEVLEAAAEEAENTQEEAAAATAPEIFLLRAAVPHGKGSFR